MQVFLVDNGSLRIDSWKNLVRVAAGIHLDSKIPVHAASLLHSDKIPASEVPPGIPQPQLLETALRAALSVGERQFIVLPFFIGPSRAVTTSLWKSVGRLREAFGWFEVRVARFLGCPMGGESMESGLAGLMAGLVEAVATSENGAPILVVDHGSPIQAVTAVRNQIAEEMGRLLGTTVLATSMERREGDIYDFNEPLLEKALTRIGMEGGQTVILAMLFLSPGRHAGADGDIDAICQDAERNYDGLRIVRTALPGMTEGIIPLLTRRLINVSKQIS